MKKIKKKEKAKDVKRKKKKKEGKRNDYSHYFCGLKKLFLFLFFFLFLFLTEKALVIRKYYTCYSIIITKLINEYN